MPPPITTVNSEPLRATLIAWQMVQMRNRIRTKPSYAINFIVANIAHYNIILGITWLQKQNPYIHWNTGIRQWLTCNEAEDDRSI
jgi:hypothetical protein